MSTKYPGGIISKTAPTPSGPYANDTAPGVWTLEQQAYWQKLGQWPTQGNVNPSAFIENLFQPWLYTGTGAAQTITNGVNLSANGGMVWFKDRTVATSNRVFDTARGTSSVLTTNITNAAFTSTNMVTAFNTNGFSLGTDTSGGVNDSGDNFVSWTFRKQPKFFDVVTYTGTGSATTIAHNLGSAPGCIIVKDTANSSNWQVYHQSLGATQYVVLNSTLAAATASNRWNDTAPTSSVFSIGDSSTVNTPGATYVAYLYAHNAGGFGLSGTENVISCGSYTGNGSSTGPVITLGYEPQWLMVKRTDSTSNWAMLDIMRGIPNTPGVAAGSAYLFANTSAAEDSAFAPFAALSATGFSLLTSNASLNASGGTYIYIAIRRGPMAVPTLGTSVFTPVSATPSGATTVTTNFPVDLAINAQRDAGTSGNKVFWDRLRGSSTAAGQGLFSNLTNAEVSYSGNGIGLQSNTTIVDNYWNTLNGATTPVIYWNFRRAPNFFDEVCYTGNSTSGATQTHNLGVVPELMIVKGRSVNANWFAYTQTLGATKYLILNDTGGAGTLSSVWNDTAPTSTTFTLGNAGAVNSSGGTYIAYLFATCPGVSKVGSYTGTGTTAQINCGFTTGARFVLIKRTDSTGDWYVWDSARGIVAGNDPYLWLNSNAAEVTSTDYVDTYSAGFEISSTAPAAINASGGTFIFLAIA